MNVNVNVFLQTIFVAICSILVMYYMDLLPTFIRKLSEIAHGKPGCVPVSGLGNVTLHYFAGRGRAEGIRLMLEYSSIPYSETKFTKDNWPAHKRVGTESGLYTFSQVPAIETSTGIGLSQSHAIMHYIGRATGLDCNCEDISYCDVIALGVEDARSKLGRMIYDPNFSMEDRNNYLKEVIPVWLGHFEKLAPAINKMERSFFVSDRRTWIDFLVFDLFDTNLEFVQYDMGQDKDANIDILEMFPKLAGFYRHFAGHPQIAQYLRSKRRFPYTIPKLPSGANLHAKKS